MRYNGAMEQKLPSPVSDDLSGIEIPKHTSKFWLKIVTLVIFVILALLFKIYVIDDSMSAAELKASVQLFNISSQWLPQNPDKIVVESGIQLLPEVTFSVRNTGKRPLRYVYFLGVFHFVETNKFIGDRGRMIFKAPLAVGAESQPLTLTSSAGYIATSLDAFSANRANWQNVQVDVFAQSKNSPNVLIKTFYISRRIAGKPVDIIIK